MFDLSLVDTLRLGFGQVVHHHKAHAHAASSFARWSRFFRVSETLLMMSVVLTALSAAFGKGHAYAIAAAVCASVALLAFLIHVTFDFEAAARAHHISSTKLWHIREQYRALLSDVTDGAVEPEFARARRNLLMEQLTVIYETAPPLTRRVFKASQPSKDTAEEVALEDREIDRFLPKSLHAPKKKETTAA